MGKILRTGITAIVVALTACCGALTGCNTSGCTDLRSSTPRADFYAAGTTTAITLDSLEIIGIGAPGDSVLITPGEKRKSVYLPMRATTDQTGWRIIYRYPGLFGDTEVADTLGFEYTPEPWFAGEECGAMYRYRIHRVTYTTNLIDSVTVLDSLVTNIDLPTLNIYFRVEI